ncbi:magnesium and cobalt transport protein CorA [Virgibacillus halodenitrificans]|uniref:Magnesium transport protein CorA n=1 Tax=Virgibacillus halodenitrificans TaxID=1482 RepID=A0AAC9IXG6_VIRHA|nr:magnesium/cobalt transporter CorA [Virgibacillus halodenitrificans]APC47901.1 magnesium and cobalt transport protein CorA [Virgibacillus halodenitrificans]WHX27874.1 magnesium/cobalt transporter CorA [Virgibacillus halodenitrificans]
MIHLYGVTAQGKLEKNIPITSFHFSNYKWIWADFNQPTDEEVNYLTTVFQFHPLAIEDCMHRLQRPKLDYYTDYTFYVTHSVRLEKDELIKEELDFFVGENFIVTFHHQPSMEVTQVKDRLLGQNGTKNWDTYDVFHQILDKIVDNYFPLIYDIEDELDVIEDNRNNRTMNDLVTELFDIRHMLVNLRHTVNPMRDLLYRMLNSQHQAGVRERKEYFSDIYDHLLKISEMIMSNREITADIRDSYLSLNAHQTNNVMKVLTIITSIFVPLTFIAGIYGMNFTYMPELTWKYGYFVSLGVMGIIAVAMYMWFKKKGWF